MGRRTEGWKLRRRPEPHGPFYVRFTHAGRRHELATGTSDQGEAERAAPSIYADVVSGRVQAPPVATPKTPSLDLFTAWLESVENTHAPSTAGLWLIYSRHFLEAFSTLADFTPAKIGDYMRARLGAALRDTVKKELSALRAFLRWAKEQGHLPTPPDVPAVPRTALGTRTGTRKAEHQAIDAETAEAVLAELPEWSSETHPDRFPVRSYFRVLWETGLRPSTIQRARVPEHYTKGAAALVISANIDKARFARRVPLTPTAREALDGVARESGLLFGKHDWRGFLERAGARAGVSADVADALSPYDMRHGRTTQLVEETGNLVGVAFLVGHKRVTTTNRYVHGTERSAASVLGLTTNFEIEKFRESDRCGANSGATVVRGGGLEPPRLLTASTSIQCEAAKPPEPRAASPQESAETRGGARGCGAASPEWFAERECVW